MQVLEPNVPIDFDTMAAGETAIVLRPDGRYVRLWRFGGKLRVSLPLLDGELRPAEIEAIAQHKLGVGGL